MPTAMTINERVSFLTKAHVAVLGRSSPLACRACGGLGAETPARAAGYMTT